MDKNRIGIIARRLVGCSLLVSTLSTAFPRLSYSQPIRSLPLDTAVPTADSAYVPIALVSPITTRRTTVGNIRSGLVHTSRVITCTAPLLCAGTTSTTLASDFTLSISAATTSSTGVVQLSANGGTTASQVVQANDSRLVGLSSGSYTPTLTNVANAATLSALALQYSRVGSVVTVSGKFDAAPTTANIITKVGISLPVASNFTVGQQLGGTCASDGGTSVRAGRVSADATNDRAELQYYPETTSSVGIYCTFTYQVL